MRETADDRAGRVACLCFEVSASCLVIMSAGMLLAGLAGEFQLGSDDYAHWEIHRWSPVLRFGLLSFALSAVASVLLLRRSGHVRIAGVLLIAALITNGSGIVKWHHRTYLRAELSSALGRISLGPGFSSRSIGYDVYDFNSGYEAPNAVRSWDVVVPPAAGCRMAAQAAATWAHAAPPKVFISSDQLCDFGFFPDGRRVTFLGRPTADPHRWILTAEIDAVG